LALLGHINGRFSPCGATLKVNSMIPGKSAIPVETTISKGRWGYGGPSCRVKKLPFLELLLAFAYPMCTVFTFLYLLCFVCLFVDVLSHLNLCDDDDIYIYIYIRASIVCCGVLLLHILQFEDL